jgi:hypothetical protein
MSWRFTLLTFLSFNICCVFAQTNISREEGMSIIKMKEIRFPKFNRELNNLLDNDNKLKYLKFIRANGSRGPAFAQPNDGSMTFDLYYFESQVPEFDDNRLVVVLYHELGHLYDNVSSTASEREEQAFRFSILKLRKLADTGDCEPLATGLKNMRLRSNSNNLSDPHSIGLKNLVSSSLFLESEKYVSNGCKESEDQLQKKNIRESRLRDLLPGFRVVRDPLNYRELYYHSNIPKSNKDNLYVYVSKRDDGQIILRLRIQYEGNNPIGVKSYLLQTGDREIIITPPPNGSISRGQNGNRFYSFYDYNVNRYTFKAVNDIVAANEVKLTYVGSNGMESRLIKSKEIEAIKMTLELYELMGGEAVN